MKVIEDEGEGEPGFFGQPGVPNQVVGCVLLARKRVTEFDHLPDPLLAADGAGRSRPSRATRGLIRASRAKGPVVEGVAGVLCLPVKRSKIGAKGVRTLFAGVWTSVPGGEAMAGSGAAKAMEWEAPGYREDVLAVLEDLFGGRPDVRRGKMFGLPAFSTGGKVFATVMGDGVALKLPPETIARLADAEIAPFEVMGKKMGGWIQISRPEAESYAADAPLFETSIGYVAEQASQPKAAVRKRAKAA
jgi:hypothetical protein